MTNVDLFGNPADTEAAAAPAPASLSMTNDMDLVQSVLADVVDEKTARLHRNEDSGAVRRCAATRGTTSVPDEIIAVVGQLVAARFLTTTRRGCATPAHGPVVIATPAGRGAVYRWRAYRRPSTWEAAHDRTGTEGIGTNGIGTERGTTK